MPRLERGKERWRMLMPNHAALKVARWWLRLLTFRRARPFLNQTLFQHVKQSVKTPIRVVVLVVSLLVIALIRAPERVMAQTPPAGPAPGLLVDIGGHKLHIHCACPS